MELDLNDIPRIEPLKKKKPAEIVRLVSKEEIAALNYMAEYDIKNTPETLALLIKEFSEVDL